jgi:hypothetical protein
MSSEYIPGVCNIGPAEIRLRRASGYLGLTITLLLFILFYFVPVDSLVRLVVFLPAALAASGFLQARLHFCARFGMSGLFNVSDDMKQHQTVDQAEYRRKDQQKALTIIIVSAAFGVVAAVVAYLLPFVG